MNNEKLDDMRNKVLNAKEALKQYIYYILISILSLLSIIVFPMLNSTANIVDTFPKDPTGWVMYILIRFLVVVMNILIFANFLQQSKINVKDHPNYIRANEILGRCKSKDYNPRGPKQYLNQVYATKGIMLALMSVVSLFVIGNAIMRYDYMVLIATVFSVIMAVVFGIMSMKRAEIYYIGEYLDYAIKVEQNFNKITKGDIEECLHLMVNKLET